MLAHLMTEQTCQIVVLCLHLATSSKTLCAEKINLTTGALMNIPDTRNN
jgi:hypothetical protein